jgi:hypothetical protein
MMLLNIFREELAMLYLVLLLSGCREGEKNVEELPVDTSTEPDSQPEEPSTDNQPEPPEPEDTDDTEEEEPAMEPVSEPESPEPSEDTSTDTGEPDSPATYVGEMTIRVSESGIVVNEDMCVAPVSFSVEDGTISGSAACSFDFLSSSIDLQFSALESASFTGELSMNYANSIGSTGSWSGTLEPQSLNGSFDLQYQMGSQGLHVFSSFELTGE